MGEWLHAAARCAFDLLALEEKQLSTVNLNLIRKSGYLIFGGPCVFEQSIMEI